MHKLSILCALLVNNLYFLLKLMSCVSDEERYTQLEELKSVMLEYCDLDNNWKHEKKILSKVDKSLREDINVNNIDEVIILLFCSVVACQG